MVLADCSHGSSGNDCAQAPAPSPTTAPTHSSQRSFQQPATGAATSDGVGLQLMAFAIALAIWLRLR